MSGLFFSRREALQIASCGFGSLALSGMLAGEEIAVGNNPLQAKQSHHVAFTAERLQARYADILKSHHGDR